MELVLNVAWFIIAAASYSLLVWHFASRDKERARDPSWWHLVVALSCVLAILFPVISLTDDLHELQATLEESSSSCRVTKECGANHRLTLVRTSLQLFCVVSSLRADVSLVDFGNAVSQRAIRLSLVLQLTTLGRAPPFFLPIS
jgi:hypothetical protein